MPQATEQGAPARRRTRPQHAAPVVARPAGQAQDQSMPPARRAARARFAAADRTPRLISPAREEEHPAARRRTLPQPRLLRPGGQHERLPGDRPPAGPPASCSASWPAPSTRNVTGTRAASTLSRTLAGSGSGTCRAAASSTARTGARSSARSSRGRSASSRSSTFSRQDARSSGSASRSTSPPARPTPTTTVLARSRTDRSPIHGISRRFLTVIPSTYRTHGFPASKP